MVPLVWLVITLRLVDVAASHAASRLSTCVRAYIYMQLGVMIDTSLDHVQRSVFLCILACGLKCLLDVTVLYITLGGPTDGEVILLRCNWSL